MSKIEQLLKKLCPNGVEYRKLAELLDYEQPGKYIVHSTNYDDSFRTPVLTAGQTFILGYTNEEDGHYKASKANPVIIFDDFTTAMQWVDFEFKVKSSAMKLLTSKDSSVANIRYLFYAMQCIHYVPVDHSRHWIEKYSQLEIPVPPIQIQREVVEVLDKFALLTAELTAELAKRKKQYEHYRDKLLNFTQGGGYKKLGECVRIRNGSDYKHLGGGTIPVYGSGGVMTFVNKCAYDKPSVLIPRKGSIEKLYYLDIPFWTVDTLFYTEINGEVIVPKYLYYVLQKEHLEQYNTAGGVPSLTQKVLNGIKILVPPLAEQERIVKILDKFDKLCNDLTSGLPAEIAARKKQYEYYRDKLLNFKRAA